MAYWLAKTEPGDYSYDDLVRDGVAEWDGVTNPTAQMHMRSMQAGDTVIIYHTGDVRAAIGVATIVRGAYPDPTDEKGKRVLVDFKAIRQLPNPVGLNVLKTDPLFAESPLVKIGRLSVVPLNPAQFAAIERMGG
jgi:predicted RNA-binding protein with PUA-like domain